MNMLYMIDVSQQSRKVFLGCLRPEIIYKRPSPWLVFLLAVFRISRNIAFVRLPEKHVNAFFIPGLAAQLHGDKLLVNGDRYTLLPWGIINLCHFCLESIQSGLLWRFWKWRICR